MVITICDPACTPGDFPGLTKVGSSSTFTLQLEVSTAVRHSYRAATSSISTVLPDNNKTLISLQKSVPMNIYITAIDTKGDVKCIELSGDWWYFQ